MIIRFTFCIIYFFITQPIYSANLKNKEYTLTNGFIENKGQIKDHQGIQIPSIKFVFHQNAYSVFLLENSLAYQFTQTHYPDGYEEAMLQNDYSKIVDLRPKIRKETFRIDMVLLNAQKPSKIIKEEEGDDYINYYGDNALNVRTYKKVTYKDVYPNIDWIIYQNDQGIKYDFMVYPGGDPSFIQIRIDSAQKINIQDNGDLILQSSMGNVIEQAPISFQENQIIETKFSQKGNVISFELKEFNPLKLLRIDPVVNWASYYGGNVFDVAQKVTTDHNGNVYISGLTNSSNNIASGGYQNTFGGVWDLFLVKFDSNGVRLWATYYLGDLYATNASCALNLNGDVFLSGSTTSPVGISTAGAHQVTYGGGLTDAFLVKFNTNGVRQWATYYGGLENDFTGYCSVDLNGNIYLSGQTNSLDNISTPGSHQPVHGGYEDAYLVKFDPNGVRQWATYYGGLEYDEGNKNTVDANGNVYLNGFTESTFGIASTGHQNTLGGVFDAYLVKFNTNGVRQWATYYGGTLEDRGLSCAVDNSGSVYLSGWTSSLNNIASAGYQNVFGGSQDAFLVKFDAMTGIRQWATYYGGSGIDLGYGLALDLSQNVYLVGWTNSTNNISSGFCYGSNGGLYDAFVVKFLPAGTRNYGLYYGGAQTDLGMSCAIYGNSIYITGRTASISNIAQLGHQNTFGGGLGDGFLARIDPFLQAPDGIDQYNVCPSNTVSLSVNVPIGQTVSWYDNNTATGTPISTSNPYVFVPISNITLYAFANFSGCTSDDYLEVDVILHSFPEVDLQAQNPTCFNTMDGQIITIPLIGILPLSYNWSNGSSQDSLLNVSSGWYYVTVTDSIGCQSKDSILLINPNAMLPEIIGFDSVCKEAKGYFQVFSNGTPFYNWSNGSMFDTVSYIINSSGYIYVNATDSNGCVEIDSLWVVAIEPPSLIIYYDSLVCSNGGVLFTAQTNDSQPIYWYNGAIGTSILLPAQNLPDTILVYTFTSMGCYAESYITNPALSFIPAPTASFDTLKDPYVHSLFLFVDSTIGNSIQWNWNFGDQTSSDIQNPKHTFTDSGWFQVQLTVQDLNGCSDTAYMNVWIDGNIVIPNVFSPNNDGKNDYFRISPTGIKDPVLKIFNRWGVKIYELEGPHLLWDGRTIAGAPVSEGTYYFMLFSKGLEKASVNGCITLLR
jgi:gliding motility-associated-like protein